MLKHIRISGYKCLEKCELALAPLTILAGPNSSGKSTVIQAMLLVFSGIDQKNTPYLKEVVKPYANFNDVYCRFSDAREIRIVIDAENNDQYALSVKRDCMAGSSSTERSPIYEESLFYLCAGRSGPEEISELNKDLCIGQHGQYALGFLELNKDKPVHQALIQNEAHAKTLKAQLAWWLSFIVGTETEARTEKITAASVKTSFDSGGIENISPFNTGAGSSFVLKMLVMCLTARPGDLLLIENPEIHLHPGAQSRLGRLLAFMAAKGVQIVVETHCEHLINRIRYEIYRKVLSAKDAVIHYKPGARDAFETMLINARGHYCDAAGQEKPFPGGFFDSTLAELLEIG